MRGLSVVTVRGHLPEKVEKNREGIPAKQTDADSAQLLVTQSIYATATVPGIRPQQQ